MTNHPSSAAEARRKPAVELSRLHDTGACSEDLEYALGLSHGTVINRLRQAGTVMRTPAQARSLKAARDEHARHAQALRLRAVRAGRHQRSGPAVKVGLSARTVRRRLVQAGASLRSGAQTRRLTADPMMAEARRRLAAGLRRRYEAGLGVLVLAAGCGRSVSTVHRLVHEAGTALRPQSRRSGKKAAKPP